MSTENGNPEKEAGNASNNTLRRSPTMDPLNRIGHLSNLTPDNRYHGPPLSHMYLQQPGMAHLQQPHRSIPPPIPPPRDALYMNRYRQPGIGGFPGMNPFYSPYNQSRYSSGLYSTGLYSPYSNCRMPYGPYAGNDAYSSFLQMAEESTRPAFESIESVVHVVNSISMMLESTYGAVHSSYSAILGVVDQFSRLKDHLAQTFSILAMLRGLHWLCLKVLYLLGLRTNNPSVEKAWRTAHKAAESAGYPPQSQGSAWPFFVFLSLVIGAPWLMFKLLSKSVAKKVFDPSMWIDKDGRRYDTLAAYDFTATQPGQLSIRAGEKLTISPSELHVNKTNRTWLLVCNERNESGLVPTNYLVTPTASLVPKEYFNSIHGPQNSGVRNPGAQNIAYRNHLPATTVQCQRKVNSIPSAPLHPASPAFSSQSRAPITTNDNNIHSPDILADDSNTELLPAVDEHLKDWSGASMTASVTNNKDSISVSNLDSLQKTSLIPEDLSLEKIISSTNDNDNVKK